MERDELRGIYAAVAAYVVWGLLTVYWKQLSNLPAWQLIGWRVVLAAITTVGFCVLTGRWAAIVDGFGDPAVLKRVVLAAVALTVNWTTYVWAVGDGRVLEVAMGYFFAPLFTMMIGVVVFRETLTPLKAAAAASATIAIGVLVASYGAIPWVAIGIGLSWSSYATIKRGVRLGPFASLGSELIVMLLPATGVVVYSLVAAGGVGATAEPWQWPLILGTGLITMLPLLLFAFAAKRVPFTLLGPLNFLVPIINFVLGWAAYHERMTLSRFVGFGFVWIALALVTVDTVRAHRRSRPVATPPAHEASDLSGTVGT